jgi:hypothetical protein
MRGRGERLTRPAPFAHVALNLPADCTDISPMSEHPRALLATPAARDRVEIIDDRGATRAGAIVESADDGRLVLRLEQAVSVSEQALVRWFDGSTAWQATARFEPADSARVICRVPPHAWEPTPTRRSARAPAANAELLARIVSSDTLPGGRRVHTECLDVSATGCRATWPGRTPRVGDTVELMWDLGDLRGGSRIELGWLAARVARIIPMASAEQEICFTFEVTRATQAARVRAWHRAWLERSPSEDHGGSAASIW